MYNIACIMMASGLSKRMGRNKLLIKIRGKAIFEYVLDAVEEADIQDKIVVSSYEPILMYAQKKGYLVSKNEKSELGQSMSIKMGVEKTRKCDGFMFLPCDMPFINGETIEKICAFFYEEKNSIVVPRIGKKNAMPTIFPYRYKKALLKIKGDIGGREIIRKNEKNVRYIQVDEQKILRDIDTEKDLESILKESME